MSEVTELDICIYFELILDAPKMKLSFGMSMSAEVIDEGKDVYFSCDVEANPEVYKVGWKHEVRLS